MLIRKSNHLKKELLKHHLELDPKENKESKIPENEKVKFRCLWVFEVYTPNYINNLYSGINKIGCDLLGRDEDLSKIIRKIREEKSFSWRDLGTIDAKNENSKLPKNVDLAFVGIFQYLSSISILSVQFVFNEETSNIIESALNKDYKTYFKINKNGYTVHSPHFQKREAINKIREEVYESCSEWYRKHIPGLYSDKLTKVKFPTCEFITLENGFPFYETNKFKYNDYIDILEISNDQYSWISDELKGIIIELPQLKKTDFTSIKIAGNSNIIMSNKNFGVNPSG